MRLDLFLKASCLCPRRTIAQKLCDAGIVLINGKAAKSAHAVKLGDEITLRRRDHLVKVRVLGLPDSRQTSRKQAAGLFETLSDEPVE